MGGIDVVTISETARGGIMIIWQESGSGHELNYEPCTKCSVCGVGCQARIQHIDRNNISYCKVCPLCYGLMQNYFHGLLNGKPINDPRLVTKTPAARYKFTPS